MCPVPDEWNSSDCGDNVLFDLTVVEHRKGHGALVAPIDESDARPVEADFQLANEVDDEPLD